MVAGNTDSSVTLTFRVREQVTPALARMEAGLGRVGNAAASTGKFLGQNALQMVAVGSAMVAGAGAAAQLAVKFGLLNEEQGKTASSFVQGAGAVVAMVGGLSQLGVFLASSGVLAGLARLGAGLSGIAGTLATIVPLAAAAGLAIASIVRTAQDPSNPLSIIPTPGAGGVLRAPESVRNIANTPIQQLAGQAGRGALNVSINTFAATESELRQAAKTLGRILQEEARIGGFQLN